MRTITWLFYVCPGRQICRDKMLPTAYIALAIQHAGLLVIRFVLHVRCLALVYTAGVTCWMRVGWQPQLVRSEELPLATSLQRSKAFSFFPRQVVQFPDVVAIQHNAPSTPYEWLSISRLPTGLPMGITWRNEKRFLFTKMSSPTELQFVNLFTNCSMRSSSGLDNVVRSGFPAPLWHSNLRSFVGVQRSLD